ncbi:MAG: hypothetical protein CME68_06855 [Halobacteriovoraceae bacterium]|nr:hypothetical protein [Halobacteriovoraceae bacterium]
MSDITPPENNENNENKVLPFKTITVEKAIENIYNTVSKKIPLKYETVEDKKVIKVPQIKGSHLEEFENIIRENIEKSKAKGFTWEETEKRLQGIIDFIIPIFRTNTLRLEDKEIKDKVNFEEYNQIWERIKKEEGKTLH